MSVMQDQLWLVTLYTCYMPLPTYNVHKMKKAFHFHRQHHSPRKAEVAVSSEEVDVISKP